MPAGLPYFAWVDASETTFGPEHLRWDEQVFSFTLAQEEGDPATLTALVRQPSVGLLSPGRKIWAWFAFDCGPALFKFRGRLVGIPTSIFEELVTLEFVAKPSDVVAQKEALADTVRVLPFYDPVMLDEDRRNDPDVVLEGYTKIWHYPRDETALTVSDEISGEDGLVEFLCANGDVFYDGLGLTLTTGPLTRVDVAAEFTWTQQARGTVDLTGYLMSHWPNTINGAIGSYTLYAADWPKTGAAIGDGWVAAYASAYDFYDMTVKSVTKGETVTVEWYDGDTTTTTINETSSYIVSGPSFIGGPGEVKDEVNVSYSEGETYTDDKGNEIGQAPDYISSYSRNYSETRTALPMQSVKATLVAGYKAERQCTERVSFSLFADVQPILTDPEDGEALRLDDFRSVNLSDPEEGVPIGDARRRSYIATERGNRSLEYLIARARAHLMKRSRVVEITIVPKLARMPEITLRKNALVTEPRVGEATGKIIGYSLGLDGADGRIKCEVKIGCTIGRGGTIAAADGDPTYCTTDYTGADYQVFINRTILFPLDMSVGYQPPAAAPNDDGIEFMSALRPQDVIEIPLVVTFGHIEQADQIAQEFAQLPSNAVKTDDDAGFINLNDPAIARREYWKNILRQLETNATFKLKSMTREFSSDYEIQVTDLKIPTGYDLEAV
jgi:hypothetical protein